MIIVIIKYNFIYGYVSLVKGLTLNKVYFLLFFQGAPKCLAPVFVFFAFYGALA